MANDIHCIQANLNHSWGAQNLLAQYMSENSIDMALISEPRHIPEGNLWFGDSSGRAAITWCPNRLKDSCVLLHKDEGFVAVSLGEICFISCYVHAKCKKKKKCFKTRCKIKAFEEFLNQLTLFITNNNNNNKGTEYIIAGDFNARSTLWGDTKTTPIGILLETRFNRLDLRLANQGEKPTCVRPQGKSVIDLTWTSPGLIGRIREWNVYGNSESLSDHLYIGFKIKTDQHLPENRIGNKKWNINKINIDLFHAVLTQRTWNLDNRDTLGIDNKIELIEEIMSNALDIAAKRSKTYHKTAKYWWNENLSALRAKCIYHKRILARTTRKEGLTNKRYQAYEKYKIIRTELRKAIKKAKSTSWFNIVDQLEQDPWGLAYKVVMNKLIRASPTPSETITPSNLAGVLEDLFPYRPNITNPITGIDGNQIEEITVTQVRQAIRGKRAKHTAPGPDGIARETWKLVNDEFMGEICKTYNQIMTTGEFPTTWKKASLTLIPKGHGMKYRPICLINDLGKGFERILVNRIQQYMEANPRAALSNKQFGFRTGKSSIDAILKVKNIIEEAINENRYMIAVSLDIKNAFNSLSWDYILQALERKGFPYYIIKLINSYLSNRYVLCKDSNGQIINKKCYAGVPQGSVLGPTLWNIAYDDVLDSPISLESSVIGYADDTVLLVGATTIQEATYKANIDLATLLLRIEEMGLKVVTQKTEAVLFCRRSGNEPVEIRIGGEYIQTQNTMKYLGVILDSKLNFRQHFKFMAEKATKTMRVLMRIMPNLRGPGEAKRRLYVTIVHSAILYAAPVWSERFCRNNVNQKPILNIQKVLALRTISAYKTVSWDASTLLARIPPFGLLAERQRRLYYRIKEYKEQGTLTKEIKIQLTEMADVIMNRQWKLFLSRRRYGRRTREAILPVFEEWIGRCHGGLSYHLTQLLTGHGSFAEFTFQIGKSEDSKCTFCQENRTDSAEHTIFECTKWDKERAKIDPTIMREKRMDLLIKDIVRRPQSWTALKTFAKEVLTKKEAAERDREQERRKTVTAGRRSESETDEEWKISDWRTSSNSSEDSYLTSFSETSMNS